MADDSGRPGFTIGELRVDPPGGEVTGPGGTQRLDPKVMGVLVTLAERAGHVVQREELMTRLWPNVVVGDDALTRCLYELRRQLALAGGGDEYRAIVETLPKRGYRLNGKVAPLAAPAVPPGSARVSRTIAWVAGTVALMAVALAATLLWRPSAPGPDAAAQYSIAVLPFLDMSEAKDQQYFADGLAEEIIDRLSQSQNLRVIARTSSFWFRGKDANVAEIARKLDVTHVLEGSVRRSGDWLRVTAQLIATRDSSHVWSTTFERETGDVFAIQDEIAAGVAAALGTAFAPRELPAAAVPGREAHEHFLRGEYLYHRRAPGDIERSVAGYEAAVASSPDYARAWASLAGAYSVLGWQSGSPAPELVEKQRLAAERAVALDPRLAIARIRLAQYFWEAGQPDKARSHRAIAKQLDPGHPIILSWASTDAHERGDIAGAIDSLRRAVEREPVSTLYRNNLAVLLLAEGQLDQALAEFQWVMELNPDGQPGADTDIVRILVLQRRYAEAKAALADLPEGKRRDHGQALLFHAPSEREQADAAFARLRADPYDGAIEAEVNDTVQLAEAYAVRGDFAGALTTLQSKLDLFASGPGLHPDALWYLRHEARVSPFLKPLHGDARWAAFQGPPP
jgi:TolB-like protein/DNA-binding winged helix-turn-helix (wHTH) protein/Tfp pilus assembly protein PilF